MDAHAAALPHDEHDAHPTAATYVKIAVILFVLTALEVGAYEVSHRDLALTPLVKPILYEILIVLSAIKFALVGMFYMHLKTDSKLLSWVFCFSLAIAAVVIVGLMILFYYMFHHGMPL